MNASEFDSDFEIDCWIDLLVGDELAEFQRKQVLSYCTENPSYWKKLAVSFCDDQVLKRSLTADSFSEKFQNLAAESPLAKVEKSGDGIHSNQSSANKTKTRTRRMTSVFVVAASVLFFVIGWSVSNWLPQTRTIPGETATSSVGEPELTVVDWKLEDPVLDALSRKNLELENQVARNKIKQMQDFLIKTPALFQLENNDKRAVYYSEHRLPDFFLQALVFAGHRIQISQQLIDVPLPDGSTIGQPVHTFEIEKFALAKEVNFEKEGI